MEPDLSTTLTPHGRAVLRLSTTLPEGMPVHHVTPRIKPKSGDDVVLPTLTLTSHDQTESDVSPVPPPPKKKKHLPIAAVVVKRQISSEDLTDGEVTASPVKRVKVTTPLVAKNELPPPPLPVFVDEQSELVMTEDGRMVVRYPKNDLRNPETVEANFRASLSAIQGADLPKAYAPDNLAYKDKIRIRVMGIKITVDEIIETSDGERKWSALGYGFVKHGVEFGMNAQLRPKLSQKDFFVAKDFQDHPSRPLPDGSIPMDMRLPSSLFQFPPTGPPMPLVASSACAKTKMKK